MMGEEETKNKTFIADVKTVKELIGNAVNQAIENKMPEILETIREDEIYTTSELCDLFKVSPATLKNWRDSGKIDWIQNGSTIRYTREHVNDCIDLLELSIDA